MCRAGACGVINIASDTTFSPDPHAVITPIANAGTGATPKSSALAAP